MARPALSGIRHVKLPVTDLARSRAWYEQVFGLHVTWEFPDDDGTVHGVAGEVPGLGGTALALRENADASRGIRGFDPVSFAVRDRADLERWAAHLDDLAVVHSPIIEASSGWLVVFDDPDGLQLHLYTWAEHGIDHSTRPGYGRRVATAHDGAADVGAEAAER